MNEIRDERRGLLKAFGAGAALAALPAGAAAAVERITNLSGPKRKLKPVLDGDWWLIGASPNLEGILPSGKPPNALLDMNSPQGEQFRLAMQQAGMSEDSYTKMVDAFTKYNNNSNEPVDHHIFQAPDGTWHLWGCVRQTSVGRVFYYWQADKLTDSPWTQTGEVIRCSPEAGECVTLPEGEEVFMSPFFVHDNGLYYMFYAGHGAVYDDQGNPVDGGAKGIFDPRSEGQICLMTSKDGKNWTRHQDAEGHSRVFTGPGGARDPCVIKVGDLWYMYYAGYEGDVFGKGGCFARTSKDLINWSDYKLVHRDGSRGGTVSFSHECAHVVYRGGYFYLFRTENYYAALTHVYRSEDPLDFGVDTGGKFVTTIGCAAPEIYTADGREYVSSNHDPELGTQMCRLIWRDA